ncbi:MAG: anthranilate synthase component I family protein [Pseudomonadota bacterium]
MKAPFDIPADLDTPVSAFLKLKDFAPVFLLESVTGGEQLGRYSFIGLGEALRVRLDSEGLRVGDDVLPRPSDRNALMSALRDAMGRAPVLAHDELNLPFRGGLVGAASYDVVRYFEDLPDTNAPSGLPDLSYVAPESVLVFDHLTRRAGVLHGGSDVARRALSNNIAAALRGPLPKAAGAASVSAPSASISEPDFLQHVSAAQEQIAAGNVYQLVLSICFSGKCDAHPFEVYRALRLLNPSPYMYYLSLDDTHVVGSSPEALVTLNDGVASLRPIAGTRPRSDDPDTDRAHGVDLSGDPKEIAEHVMLVDLARNDLGRVARPGTVRVDPYRVIERYSHVMHLVSGVSGELEPDYDAFDLFAAAFPAGTLVGAPKVKAMSLIDEVEPVRRGWYAGTVGYFGHGGSMDQAIAIRTMILRNGTYQFQAGAGIVADSDPKSEYNEVLAKSQILRQALAMAEAGL